MPSTILSGRCQYCMVFSTLLSLTGVTVGAALMDLGVFNPIVALGIACVKAMIVILFFMHVAYSSRLVKLTVLRGILHVSGADHDDVERLHQPGVGALVEREERIQRTKAGPAKCRPFLFDGVKGGSPAG